MYFQQFLLVKTSKNVKIQKFRFSEYDSSDDEDEYSGQAKDGAGSSNMKETEQHRGNQFNQSGHHYEKNKHSEIPVSSNYVQTGSGSKSDNPYNHSPS